MLYNGIAAMGLAEFEEELLFTSYGCVDNR